MITEYQLYIVLGIAALIFLFSVRLAISIYEVK